MTSPARTIVDCAGISDPKGVRRDDRAGRGTAACSTSARSTGSSTGRGDGAPKRLLRALEPWRRYTPGIKIRSRMEAKLLPLLTEAALPIPQTNADCGSAGKAYEVDFLWRRQKLVVETDGGRFHDNPAAGARDSDRNRALTDAGYRVPRLGWEDLRDRPEAAMREIARLLRR